MQKSFFGYRRDNGRVGIRNHVLILPLDDLSQPACDAVANNIGGTVAIQHPYGRLQFGADLDLHFRTLIGAGSNPNVAAVIVIGIEEKWTQDVVDGIAKTGKPVAGFGIEQHGQIDTIARASRKAKEFVQYASALQKVECPISDLWVSCKCGESDTTSGLASCPTVGNAFDKLYEEGCTLVFGETTELTGGEHLVKARCANDRVRSEFTAFFDRYAKVIDDHKTSDLSDSQPTKGNIEGGLTTIEEKALGNIQKIGTKAPVIGTLDKAVTPTGPGLWFMDSSSAAAEMITLVAAAGYVVPLLPHRPGQHHRQPDRARYQTVRQPAHHPYHVRTHGRGRVRYPAPRNESRPGWRQAARHDVPDHRRPYDRRRSSEAEPVRYDPSVRKRLISLESL